MFGIASVPNNRAEEEPEMDSKDVVLDRWLVLNAAETVENEVVANVADEFRYCRLAGLPVMNNVSLPNMLTQKGAFEGR